jgi:hypothetical protein
MATMTIQYGGYIGFTNLTRKQHRFPSNFILKNYFFQYNISV